MIQRHLTASLLRALKDSPVVLLVGPRQAGKTTLTQMISEGPHKANYLTLDTLGVLSGVKDDPEGFVRSLEGAVVIDEIQKAPELFVAIKTSVDRQRSPGRFLLTGSANVLLLPRLSESLAGRMEVITLWGLAQSELEAAARSLPDALFEARLPEWKPAKRRSNSLARRVLLGGYPEVLARPDPGRREAWFSSYLTTILQRDVRDVANIDGLVEMPRLLSILAARAGSLQSFAEISRDSKIPQTTLKRYMALLQTIFLTLELPAWSTNLSKRMVKAPKLFLTDSGLLAHLLGASDEQDLLAHPHFGHVLENFVTIEVLKQLGWSRQRARLYHFRTAAGQEVDLVLENAKGQIVGLEVKATTTLRRDDFEGLKRLREASPGRFVRGVVLYRGEEQLPFGEGLAALPISMLWSG